MFALILFFAICISCCFVFGGFWAVFGFVDCLLRVILFVGLWVGGCVIIGLLSG